MTASYTHSKLVLARQDFLRQAEIHFESLRPRIGAEELQIPDGKAGHGRLDFMGPRDLLQDHLHLARLDALIRHQVHPVRNRANARHRGPRGDHTQGSQRSYRPIQPP